jgi:hypothetical protein
MDTVEPDDYRSSSSIPHKKSCIDGSIADFVTKHLKTQNESVFAIRPVLCDFC